VIEGLEESMPLNDQVRQLAMDAIDRNPLRDLPTWNERIDLLANTGQWLSRAKDATTASKKPSVLTAEVGIH